MALRREFFFKSFSILLREAEMGGMITIDFVADLLKGQAGHLACYVK